MEPDSGPESVTRTVSGGGVVVSRGRVALVRQHGDVWSLPKGHVEAGENEIDAALREIREETGIRKVVYLGGLGAYERPRIGLDGRDEPSELKSIHMFLFSAKKEHLRPEDPKILEARWVPAGEVAALLTHPKDRAFFLSVADRLPERA